MKRIRNIGIMAHIDAGKTTTTERLLFLSGYSRRVGEVHDGDTIMDYLPLERERGITINSAAISFQWANHDINLIDTPGHVDFTVEVERSLRVLDGAIAIFDGVAGVEAQSETVWEQADRYGVPRIGFVNKMDREGASYERTAAAMAARLGATPVLCQLPLGEAAEFQGIVDLISMRSYLWKEEEELSFKEVPLTSFSPAIAEKAESQRLAMLEAVADADDTFAEVFLDGKVKESDVIAALRRTTILPGSRIVPLLCGSAYKNKAIQPLLDAVVDFLPSPEERPPLLAHPIKRNAKVTSVERKPSASEPLCALAFKVQKDDSRGPLVFFRVYSGTLRRGMPLLNTTQNTKERPNKLLQVLADEQREVEQIAAGQIGAAVGLKVTRTGDTLCVHGDPLPVKLAGIRVPPPVFAISLEVENSVEAKKLEEALEVLLREDPSLKKTYDEETDQVLLHGMGELHLEVTLHRLRHNYGVDVTGGKVRVAYKEGVITEGEAEFTCDREFGSQQHFATLCFKVEPAEDNRHNDIQAFDGVLKARHDVDTAAPRPMLDEHQEVLREAIVSALDQGPLVGLGVVGVKVSLVPERCLVNRFTTPVALRIAANGALKAAMEASGSVVMEPFMHVEVSSLEKDVGHIVNDIVGHKQGRVESIAPSEAIPNRSTVTAIVPLTKMVGYATQLRSMTAGEATFTMEFSEYGPVSLADQSDIIGGGL